MSYSAVPKYKNSFTNYQIILYGRDLMPVIMGKNVLDFDLIVRRDKMPIAVLGGEGNSNVTIIRRGRLVQGTFSRFMSDNKDTQTLLFENIDKNQFPKVYEMVEKSVSADQIMDSVKKNNNAYKDFTTQEGVQEYTQQLNDAGLDSVLKFFSRPGLRLKDFNGLNMVLIGIPESAEQYTISKYPNNVLFVQLKDVRFQGNSINISIDNPNVLEQVSFYQKNCHMYVAKYNEKKELLDNQGDYIGVRV